MPKKRGTKTCPITGQPVLRTKSTAVYSSEGIQIRRNNYLKEYHKLYYQARKLIGIGLLLEENKHECGSIVREGTER